MSELKRFDRCIVVDLRTGKHHRGAVEELRTNGKVVVRYDTGHRVAVHKSFVSAEET